MNLYLSTVKLTFSNSQSIKFELLPSVGFNLPVVPPTTHFICNYSTSSSFPELDPYDHQFTGNSFDPNLMPYNWRVLNYVSKTLIHINYIDKWKEISDVLISIDNLNKKIDVLLITDTKSEIVLDPLFHPVGSLMMVYLSHLAGGFLIHASGVSKNNKNYIFTAVSGTGKSTMAKIWKAKGASIINDDRLWIQKINDQWYMFNTPMVFYSQTPKAVPISKIFLIRQSKTNEITKLSGIKSSMQIMANCIQHLFNKEITSKHLDSIIDFTQNTPFYDCGFKPNDEITDLIERLDS